MYNFFNTKRKTITFHKKRSRTTFLLLQIFSLITEQPKTLFQQISFLPQSKMEDAAFQGML